MDSTEIGFSDRDTRSRSVLDLNVSATEAAVATGEFLSFSGDGLADEGCAAFPSDVPRWKRALDIALILIAFPVVFPVMMLVAAVIRIGSPGPVLFTQERVGYRSRRFRLYKFRTMAVGANTSVHQQHFSHLISSNLPMAKMDTKGDSRLIPLGRLLRASGLDELPQGINVLLGDMSLVGPRPCIPYEYEKYLPWHKERFNTLPGLTGLWQVSGKSRTTFTEMMHLDVHYVRNKSVWLDIKIILKTVPAMFGQVRDAVKRGRPPVQAAKPEVAEVGPNKSVVCSRDESAGAFTSKRVGNLGSQGNTKKPLSVGVVGCGYRGPGLERFN